jgi:hypothetical protein
LWASQKKAFDRRRLAGAVHPLLLSVGPRVIGRRQAMFDAARHCPRTNAGQGSFGKKWVDTIGDGIKQMRGERACGFTICLVNEGR